MSDDVIIAAVMNNTGVNESETESDESQQRKLHKEEKDVLNNTDFDSTSMF